MSSHDLAFLAAESNVCGRLHASWDTAVPMADRVTGPPGGGQFLCLLVF